MVRQFFYSRKTEFYKLDTEGNKIPKTGEDGVPIPQQFETEERIFQDSFNKHMVIRSMEFPDHLIILLNDGHETTDVQRTLKNPTKPASMTNINEVKTRIWVQSEIRLTGEDIDRFKKEINED